jgi:predicted restriction endonuclease
MCRERHQDNQRRYRRRLRASLVEKFGGKCKACGATELLEFAHKQPNHIRGPGRGSQRRYSDVKRNPDNYLLLCKPCHYAFDNPEDVDGVNYDPREHWS